MHINKKHKHATLIHTHTHTHTYKVISFSVTYLLNLFIKHFTTAPADQSAVISSMRTNNTKTTHN